jgi:hypothetical protein
MIITPTEDEVFTALRAFLVSVLPAGVEVIQGQDNRVPEPRAASYVTMTPLRIPQLSSATEDLDTLGLNLTVTQSSEFVVQLDVHGTGATPSASDNAGIITVMFRSGYGTDFFDATPAISPLYCSDPRQAPFMSGEQQYEDRYVVEASLQVNYSITNPAQSAQTLTVGIVDVETTAPPAANWPNATVTAP